MEKVLIETEHLNSDAGWPRPSLVLCVSWVLLNAIGLGIGYGVANLLVNAAQLSYPIDLIASGVCAGLGLGIAQWIVVRKLFADAWKWILLTTLGFATGPLLYSVLTTGAAPELLAGRFPGSYLAEAIQGLMLGSLQWTLLRRNVDRAAVWILATVVGNMAGQIFFWRYLAIWDGRTYGILNRVAGQFLSFSIGACIGALSAVVTYAGLAFLFWSREPASSGGGK